MADVYKFKVKLCELENYIWREIEITSLSSVAKLGYAILGAFSGTASHLFCVIVNGKRYEFLYEEDNLFEEELFDPGITKLASLRLNVGDTLTMEYDYGAGWEFDIELMAIEEMKKGAGTHYPYITDGKGNGIIEDASPGILIEFIEQTDREGVLPTYYDFNEDKEMEWDYRKCDLEYLNSFYKFRIAQIKAAYENVDLIKRY